MPNSNVPASRVGARSRILAIQVVAIFVILMTQGEGNAESEIPVVDPAKARANSFTENRGQWDGEILYRVTNGGITMWFTREGIYYQFVREKGIWSQDQSSRDIEAPRQMEQMIFKATFVDIDAAAVVVPSGLMEYKCNYFLGVDQSRWATDVPNFSAIEYQGLYAGTNLKFTASENGLVAGLTTSEPSESKLLRLQFEGVESVERGEAGALILNTRWGQLLVPALSVVGENDGFRSILVPEISADQIVTWPIEANRESSYLAPLLVTPSYSTYLGGSANDGISDLAVNSSGQLFVAGYTTSSDFPTVGAYDNTLAGEDVFVTKFSATGQSLVFSTYLGGALSEYYPAIAITNGGTYAIFLAGRTGSNDFPTANAIDPSANGNDDAFVAVLGPNGNTLPFATYLGGSTWDYATSIAVVCTFPCDSERYTVWVTGNTQSANFPTAFAYSTTLNGFSDVFLTSYAIGVTGISMGRSTFFGGGAEEFPQDIALLGSNPSKPVIVGYTRSADFPTVMAHDAGLTGTQDMFLSAFAFAGNGVVYPTMSTYFGGSDGGSEYGEAVVIRPSGNALIIGSTGAFGLATAGAYDTIPSSADGIIAEFSLTSGVLVNSSYFGGTGLDDAYALFEKNGNVYIAGQTTSTDLPMVNPYDNAISGTWDAFAAILNSSLSSLLWSTYLGGSNLEIANSLVVDNSYCAYIAGNTLSTNFPLVNPYDPVAGANGDAFVTKICVPLYTCGDADGNSLVSISDVVFLISYIFAGGPAPNPLAAGDADCSGIVNISDAVYLINYIFSGGAVPCASCP